MTGIFWYSVPLIVECVEFSRVESSRVKSNHASGPSAKNEFWIRGLSVHWSHWSSMTRQTLRLLLAAVRIPKLLVWERSFFPLTFRRCNSQLFLDNGLLSEEFPSKNPQRSLDKTFSRTTTPKVNISYILIPCRSTTFGPPF